VAERLDDELADDAHRKAANTKGEVLFRSA